MIEVTLNKLYIIIVIYLLLFAVGLFLNVYHLYLSRKFFLYLKSTKRKKWESFKKISGTPFPNSPIPKTLRTIPYIFSNEDEDNIQIKSMKKKLRFISILSWSIWGILILGIFVLYFILNHYFSSPTKIVS